MTADLRLDPGRKRPPANHSPHIGLEQGIAGQFSGSTTCRAEKRSFTILGDAGTVLISRT
jgi:hypothetical protein